MTRSAYSTELAVTLRCDSACSLAVDMTDTEVVAMVAVSPSRGKV
jgi:hypothetical protein